MTHSAEPDDVLTEQPTPSHAKHQRGDASDEPAARAPGRLAVGLPLLISLVALGVASWSILRTPTTEAPAPTAQQVADAKTKACAAYTQARTAVAVQSQGNAGGDPAATQMVAVNARLAMAVGSQHIIDSLNPAVPTELADSLRSVAAGLQELAVNALAGTSGDEAGQLARLHDLETTSQKIVALCT